MTPFETAVKTYLDNRAANDEQFARVYAKPNKNFKECIAYIYDEDDISVDGEAGNNITAQYISDAAKEVELTDAEKEEARRLAVQNEAERIRRKMQDDADRRKKAAAERAKIAKEVEAQSDVLFTFND